MPAAAVTLPQVNHVLPEVEAAQPLWATVRDVLEGQEKVKKEGEKYLPKPNPGDKSQENSDRYEAYKTRALFANMTARTLAGMVGTVFSKEPIATLPDALMPLYENVDGGAVTLDQQAKKTLADVLSVGRAGLLTDYPPKPSVDEVDPADPTKVVKKTREFTREDINAGLARPTIQFYFAEDIINWRYEIVGGLRKLSLVVLHEMYVMKDDGFKKEEADQWRELRLVDGRYTVTIWQKVENGNIQPVSSFTPTKADGQPFDYIPFEFIGVQNNDAGIDDVPLLDLANLNIAHYRNSADFEEMVFILGQPTTVISGLTEHWAKEILGGEVKMGSVSALLLPEGAQAQYLQVSESQIALKAMEHKERQAVALGARLVNDKTVQRTAKEAGMDDAAEQSTLLSATKNVNSAYKRAIESAALYAGATISEDMGYEINTDFEILTLDAAALAARVKMWVDGVITFEEVRSILRRAGIATKDDAAARTELDADALRNAEALGLTEPGEPKNTPAKEEETEE